ncbi:unnamed protein product, partial [Laminaria digitata]
RTAQHERYSYDKKDHAACIAKYRPAWLKAGLVMGRLSGPGRAGPGRRKKNDGPGRAGPVVSYWYSMWPLFKDPAMTENGIPGTRDFNFLRTVFVTLLLAFR